MEEFADRYIVCSNIFSKFEIKVWFTSKLQVQQELMGNNGTFLGTSIYKSIWCVHNSIVQNWLIPAVYMAPAYKC